MDRERPFKWVSSSTMSLSASRGSLQRAVKTEMLLILHEHDLEQAARKVARKQSTCPSLWPVEDALGASASVASPDAFRDTSVLEVGHEFSFQVEVLCY